MQKQDSKMSCSFCGRTQPDINKFIASPNGNAFICQDCVDICGSILKDEDVALSKTQKVLSPMQIKKHLDDFIVGQDDAKIVLRLMVFHRKR